MNIGCLILCPMHLDQSIRSKADSMKYRLHIEECTLMCNITGKMSNGCSHIKCISHKWQYDDIAYTNVLLRFLYNLKDNTNISEIHDDIKKKNKHSF